MQTTDSVLESITLPQQVQTTDNGLESTTLSQQLQTTVTAFDSTICLLKLLANSFKILNTYQKKVYYKIKENIKDKERDWKCINLDIIQMSRQ